MKKIILFGLLALFCISLASAVGHVYLYSCEQLQNINDHLTWDYSLARDIDCSDTVNWNGGDGFKPIGSTINKFFGCFNGGNHTIVNLYINRPNENNTGLFSQTYTNCITNFRIIDANITGYEYVGVIGSIHNDVSLISSSGNIYGNSYTGGIVGKVVNGTINNVHSYANVYNSNFAGGGITGSCDATYKNNVCIITNSYSYGNITGNNDVGGIAGNIGKGFGSTFIINNSYSTSNIAGVSDMGGVVGEAFAQFRQTVYIDNVFWNNHSENPDKCIGGITGMGTVSIDCTTIQDNEPYFYDVSNEPIAFWDFDNIWSDINNGTDFPIFKWEEEKGKKIKLKNWIDGVKVKIKCWGKGNKCKLKFKS